MNLVLSSLFPVFSLLLIGSLLKRLKLTNEMFLKLSDRLVYFIFFPLLFLNQIEKDIKLMQNAFFDSKNQEII